MNSLSRLRGRPLRWLALALAATACAPLTPLPPARPPAPAVTEAAARGELGDTDYLRSRQLMVPVAGVRPERVPDTYNAARGSRIHRAVDIVAPRGTAVLSADDGRVMRLRRNAAGGITIYAVDPGGRLVYYYAHLDRYENGLAEGTKLAKGQVIGYVGTTGNAPRNEPHLHFQVMRASDGRRWWDGTPLDPRPYFANPGTTPWTCRERSAPTCARRPTT